MKLKLSAVLLVLASCSSGSDKPIDNSSKFGAGISLGIVNDDRLEEVSGLVASRNHPGMLWVHNDSGNPAEIYLLDSQAAVQATFVLGETQRDWEDITTGPGPEEGVNYLYVGDIGDNFTIYNKNHVYRFREPTTIPNIDTVRQIDTIAFVYPDEQWDAETLLLDPLTRTLYLLTKEMSYTRIYCLPYPQRTDTVTVAEHVLTVPFEGANMLDRLVSGDISADGQEFLLKTYQQVFYRARADSNLFFAEWITAPPDTLLYVAEPQGEAIGFATDGSGYYTLSESQVGSDLHLYFYPRRSGSR